MPKIELTSAQSRNNQTNPASYDVRKCIVDERGRGTADSSLLLFLSFFGGFRRKHRGQRRFFKEACRAKHIID